MAKDIYPKILKGSLTLCWVSMQAPTDQSKARYRTAHGREGFELIRVVTGDPVRVQNSLKYTSTLKF